MLKGLTRRQQQILDYIEDQVEAKGYPPSVREIGSAIGLSSSSTVHSHLTALERKGLVKRDPTKPRALLLANRRPARAAGTVTVPLIGQVAAGSPVLAVENIEDEVVWPQGLTPEPSFALRVKGDSMIDDGIHDGDIVLVRQQASADNGDTVVALIEDEATVKRFYKEKGRARLEPANPAYQPIYSSELAIVGKVVGLIRRF
jgi:repressor LexA